MAPLAPLAPLARGWPLSLLALGIALIGSSATSLASSAEDDVVKAIVGCYEIVTLEVDSANPTDATVERVKTAKSLCLADSQAAERVVVSAKATGGDVVASWTFDVAEEPLRCKGCFLLVGADGKLDWDGEAHAAKASEPRFVTVRAGSMGSTFRFIVK